MTGLPMHQYTETTHDVTVSVQPFFLEERSNILQRQFFFVYFVTIINERDEMVQLMRRHWFIHDAGAEDYEVEGEGVVGAQPIIPPGGSHSYNSFCVLTSFEGSMEGTYRMRRPDGTEFDIAIPRFHLVARAN